MNAIISDDGVYRYWLDRRSEKIGPVVTFIMLNPSTADAEKDDPTIRRCLGFADSFQCGPLIVVNLFAYRATKPADMKKAINPIGPLNTRYILEAAKRAQFIICAWGPHGRLWKRDSMVHYLLSQRGYKMHCLGYTADGFPRHPLMVKADALLVPFKEPKP